MRMSFNSQDGSIVTSIMNKWFIVYFGIYFVIMRPARKGYSRTCFRYKTMKMAPVAFKRVSGEPLKFMDMTVVTVSVNRIGK
jgi:hypothetical protein